MRSKSARTACFVLTTAFAASALADDPPGTRSVTIEQPILRLPVREGAPVRRLKLTIGGETIREFDIALDPDQPQLWADEDLSAYVGKLLTITSTRSDDGPALEKLPFIPRAISNASANATPRPGVHFTAPWGWLNDPNGLVYHNGVYHLYYQHNPYGWAWGNMHWGHATSPDLITWTHEPIALRPKVYGDWCFSGSAIIDDHNTSGFGREGKPPIVAAYTSTGRGECIIYSNDGGRTFEEFKGNPVVKHAGRDPRLLWHEPTRRWVMAVYDETNQSQRIAIYTSHDLKTWRYESAMNGFFECPELFEMKIENRPGESRWVLYAADGKYMLGQFDGREFQPDSAEKHSLWHGNFYASQTYSNAPGGRRIQIGWARGIDSPGAMFNQQMNIPVELRLRETASGLRLAASPAAELARYQGKPIERRGAIVKVGEPLVESLDADSDFLDISMSIEARPGANIRMRVGETAIAVDMKAREIIVGDQHAAIGSGPSLQSFRARMIVDRRSIEVFAQDGTTAIAAPFARSVGPFEMKIEADGGELEITELSIARLRPSWDPAR